MQPCSKKNSFLSILNIQNFQSKEQVGQLQNFTHTTHLNKGGLRKIINEKSRQNTANIIKKDFFKLFNDSNLAYNCRNDLDNCAFESM